VTTFYEAINFEFVSDFGFQNSDLDTAKGPHWRLARGTESKVEQLLVTFGIVLALFFAFVSGVHDGGNLVAASVLSRSIAPQRALLLATAAVFVGPLLYGSAVAVTLSEVFLEKTIIQPSNRIPLCLFLVSGVASAT